MKLEVHDKEFARDLDKAVKATMGAKQLLAIGDEARQIIKTRTESGQDSTGRRFTPYSTKPTYISKQDRPAPRGGVTTPRTTRKVSNYAKRTGIGVSASRGRRGGKSVFFPRGYAEYKRNLYGPVVNLTKTGRMLSAIRYRRSGNKKIILEFVGTEANMKASFNQQTRRFFGIGEITSERERIAAVWRRANGV